MVWTTGRDHIHKTYITNQRVQVNNQQGVLNLQYVLLFAVVIIVLLGVSEEISISLDQSLVYWFILSCYNVILHSFRLILLIIFHYFLVQRT